MQCYIHKKYTPPHCFFCRFFSKLKRVYSQIIFSHTAPVKIPFSLYRSNSFSCRSSPRRFYAVRRLDSQQHTKKEEEREADTAEKSFVNKGSSMKNVLLSNFQSPQAKKLKLEEDSGLTQDQIDDDLRLPRQRKTRRNIFGDRTLSETSCTDTISFHSSEIACLSPAKESVPNRLCPSTSCLLYTSPSPRDS